MISSFEIYKYYQTLTAENTARQSRNQNSFTAENTGIAEIKIEKKFNGSAKSHLSRESGSPGYLKFFNPALSRTVFLFPDVPGSMPSTGSGPELVEGNSPNSLWFPILYSFCIKLFM
jgi:hypothetical protein